MNITDPLSKYVTYGEGIRSENAIRLNIPNIPDEAQLAAMKYVATEVFDKVREHFGVPLHVNSFLRVPALNSATPGASKTSSHMKGEAIDLSLLGRNMEVFKWVYENRLKLDLDQLIYEYGTKDEPAWVHVSKVSYRKNRNEVLRYYHNQAGDIQCVSFDLF